MKPSPAPGTAAPRYLQVATELRAAIIAGDFADGAPLPTESVLCARYAVSRFTVREALRRLQGEGLIRRKRGSGTVVDTGRVLRQPLSDVQELLQYAAGSTFRILPVGLLRLSAALAHDLGQEANDSWFHIDGIRTTGREPASVIAVTDVYIHRDLAVHVPQLTAGPAALFSQLETLAGIHIARIEQDISAVAAGASEAERLGVPRRSPCLRIMRSYIDATGRTVEISVSTHPGDRFTYSMHIDN